MVHTNGDRQIDLRDKNVDSQGDFPVVSPRDFWIIIAPFVLSPLPLTNGFKKFPA